MIKKLKNTVPWTILLVILKLLERFTKDNYKKKKNQKEVRVE